MKINTEELDPRIIDSKRISELIAIDEGSSAFASDLVAHYVSEAAEMVAGIKTAFASWDLATVAFLAHKLKSSSGNVGARRISQLCLRIEEESTQLCRPESLWLIIESLNPELLKFSDVFRQAQGV